jgi:putative copper export protein
MKPEPMSAGNPAENGRSFRKTLVIVNGFLHDFAAGIWLAGIVTISWLHHAHQAQPETTPVLNALERRMFWSTVAAAVLIMATGAGRTFTYVDNWYGEGAERARRRALLAKHVILLVAYGLGYWYIWTKVFH